MCQTAARYRNAFADARSPRRYEPRTSDSARTTSALLHIGVSLPRCGQWGGASLAVLVVRCHWRGGGRGLGAPEANGIGPVE